VLTRVVDAVTRAPRATLAVWGVATVMLAVLGSGVQGRLADPSPVLPGTPSARAQALADEQFGEKITLSVLLHGPAQPVREQAQVLTRALGRERATTVLSPYDVGSRVLAPRPGVAMLVVTVRRPQRDGLAVAASVRRRVNQTVRAPVQAAVTGAPVITADLKDGTFAAVASAERIAVVVLLIVLLLVFRTPGAALVPAVIGASTVLSGYGVLWLLTHVTTLDVFAATLCSMMGLALGVDYSLLLVSRFREHLPGSEPTAAARAATLSAGRTVLFAGGVLTAAMVVAILLAPGGLLVSSMIGVLVTALVSMVAAVTAVPAVLCLLGERIERWPLHGGERRGLAALTAPLRARPRRLTGVLLVVFCAAALPAFGLHAGPPGVGELPAGAQASKDFRTISRIMGAGWASPLQVTVATRSGPITTKRRLAALERFQRRLARDGRVAAVVGPGALNAQLAPVTRNSGVKRSLGELDQARRGTARLRRGLRAATGGLQKLDAGLGTAASGAGGLSTGSHAAAEGTGRLADGLDRATLAAGALDGGIGQAADGARRLKAGLVGARSGARQLATALRRVARRLDGALPRVSQLSSGLASVTDGLRQLDAPASTVESNLTKGLEELRRMSAGKLDPRYRQAVTLIGEATAAATGRDPRTGAPLDPAYGGLQRSIAQAAGGTGQAATATGTLGRQLAALNGGLSKLAAGATKLDGGLLALSRGQRRLVAGLAALHGGGAQLESGIAKLATATDRLRSGLQRLSGGASQLAGGLNAGSGKVDRLAGGLAKAERSVGRLSGRLDTGPAAQVRLLDRRSPGASRSPYLQLAALDGANRARRAAASFVINLDRGGDAAAILVIPSGRDVSTSIAGLRDSITRSAERVADANGLRAGVGGDGAKGDDFGKAMMATLLKLIVALALLSFVLLTAIFRAPVLAAVAVALNLLGVAVTFAILRLCFQDPGLLGGHGEIDAGAITSMYTIIFALSIDYEVFLLARIREHHVAGHDTTEAVERGLQQTARVITGAAAIMIGVFTVFAFADVGNVRQSGVGLATAVLLDATIIRLLLLPAVLRVLGERCWWMPHLLDRHLPTFDPEPTPQT
jgi:RND superfamily putative drug exporter